MRVLHFLDLHASILNIVLMYRSMKVMRIFLHPCSYVVILESKKYLEINTSFPIPGSTFTCSYVEIIIQVFNGVLHPRSVFGLFLHFSQKLQHIGNK